MLRIKPHRRNAETDNTIPPLNQSNRIERYSVCISDHNFDKWFDRTKPAHLDISLPNKGITMRSTVSNDPLSPEGLIVSISFHSHVFKGEANLAYSSIDHDILEVLIETYSKYIYDMLSNTVTSPLTWHLIIKRMRSFVRKLTDCKVKYIIKHYSMLKSISIYSVLDNGGNENLISVGRTIFELDADILTIISSKIKEGYERKALIRLHMCNSTLGNYVFLVPLLRLLKALRIIRSILIYFTSSIFLFPLLLIAPGNITLSIIEILLPVVGIPISQIFLRKLIQKYIKSKLQDYT